ncbi:MAG: acetate--CoA ligase family protein [Candidatus Caldarchaeum sp.]
MSGLDFFFNPGSVAVAGVSRDESKIGRVIYDRLLENKRAGLLQADLYPVGASGGEIRGARVYRSLDEIGSGIDLVVVAVPAAAVPDLIVDAGRCGVRAAVVVSGGFSEAGNHMLDRRLREAVAVSGVRVLGPNTVGVLDPYTGVETFFTKPVKPFSDGKYARTITYPPQGGVALISQSGALAYFIIDSLGERNAGLRAAACVGNQVDVNIAELVGYFAEDRLTKVVAVYVEGLDDGREFLNEVLRARRAGKQVVVLKAGRTAAGGRAAYTHTASMVGEWDVYYGAFRQAGAVVVDNVRELVDVAFTASLQRPPKNRKAFVLSNAGGFSVMASDLAAIGGLELPHLPEDAVARLEHLKQSGILPAIVVPSNPLDLSGSATPQAFEEAYKALSGEFGIHLLMPFHLPPAMDDTVVERLSNLAAASGATVVACDAGGSEWALRMRRLFVERGVPALSSVEDAVRALCLYSQAYTPSRSGFPPAQLREGEVSPIPRAQLHELLERYGLETAGEKVVFDEAEAVEAAERIGFPVVMKVASYRLPHKTDVGGVVVGVDTAEAVVKTFERLSSLAHRLGVGDEGVVVQETVKGVELLLGAKTDRVFGPVVTVGVGGVFTELVRDFITFVSPVDEEEAGMMLAMLRSSRLLAGFRNLPPADPHHLTRAIASFSRILYENPSIHQLEINPLMVLGSIIKAVDFRGLRTAADPKPTNI